MPNPAVLLDLNVQFPEGAMTTVEMVLRTIHLLAGITWIGLLYYFTLVQMPVMARLDPGTHGKVIPVLMPRAMAWFRWGALVTVLAGLLYFLIYLMRDAKNAVSGSWGAWLGMWFGVWAVAWFLLYLTIKKVPSGWAVGVIAVLVVTGASWTVLELLGDADISNRSLSIAVGGGIGLVLVLNVWGVVWRCQKRLIEWTRENQEQGTPFPPEAAGLQRLAAMTARVSAWLTIPMVFFMGASSHYPFLSGR